MAAHRYWRILQIISPTSNGNCRVSEIVLRTSVGGANIATGGLVIASHSGSAANLPEKANDGNLLTFWYASNGNFAVNNYYDMWIGYDFGVANEKDVVEAGCIYDPSMNNLYPERILAQFSDDGVTWTIASAGMNVTTYGTYILDSTWNGAVARRSNTYYDVLGLPSYGAPGVTYAGKPKQFNAIDGGNFQITGTTKNTGTPNLPVSRRVQILAHDGFRIVGEQWSDPITGVYTFTGLKNQPYFVVSFDHTLNYNMTGKDQIYPDPMT